MEDIEREGESELDLDEAFQATSVVTVTSSQFHRIGLEKEEEEDASEIELIASDPGRGSQMPQDSIQESKTPVLNEDGPSNPQLSASTLKSVSTGSKAFQPTPFDDSFSNETQIGVQRGPSQILTDLESVQERKGDLKNDRAQPIFYMELKRFKKKEEFDAFSEDEEPVLRTGYTPIASKEPECPEPVVREEKLIVYDVRKNPNFNTLRERSMKSENDKRRKQSMTSSTSLFSRPSIARRTVRPSSSTSLDWKFQDLTPHQRDIKNVSFEELSPADVAIIKGLWKCITFNLWSFGALTTINFFRIRGHIAFNDQKATPEELMKCRLLWPHANQAMKSLEAVVLNLHKPERSHELVYELGKKHGKLKIPLNETQCQMVINSFLYTFYQHVHPKMTLKELNILRKFSNITMFLFMDASRWDAEPLFLY